MHLAFNLPQHKETCRRKYRFTTKGRARQAIIKMLEQGKSGLGMYRCEHCLGFHVGNTPKKLEVHAVV